MKSSHVSAAEKRRDSAKDCVPQLLTSGIIAEDLGLPLHRVLYVLRTRKHIRPSAHGGIFRLYDLDVIAQVRHEISAIDARRKRLS